MDPNPFKDIPVHSHDLLMVYDYSRLSPMQINDISAGSYEQIHLVAWSMGVWTAALSFAGEAELFATATAINGTLSPFDDRCGINSAAVTNMISSFSPQTLLDFYESMFIDRRAIDRFLQNRPQRSQNDILHELVLLRKYYIDQGAAGNIFDRQIVGSRDRIFPARNQARSWGKERCSIIRAPHFPFYGWTSWDSIISDGTGIE